MFCNLISEKLKDKENTPLQIYFGSVNVERNPLYKEINNKVPPDWKNITILNSMSMAFDSKSGELISSVKKEELNPLDISFYDRNQKRCTAFSNKRTEVQLLFDALQDPKSCKITDEYKSFFETEIPEQKKSSWFSFSGFLSSLMNKGEQSNNEPSINNIKKFTK